MANDVPEGLHVDFEVIAVMDTNLIVRFRINDRRFDQFVVWNGQGDVLEFIKLMAPGVAARFSQPPPVSFDLLQAQVGKQGHVVVPPPIGAPVITP